MPFGRTSVTVHTNDLHTGSAGRNLAGGVAGLTNSKLLEAAALRGMYGTFGDGYTVAQGVWVKYADVGGTDYDPALLPTAGYIQNSSEATLDEIKYPAIALTPGTYLFSVVMLYCNGCAILEVMHGNTVLKTIDAYRAAQSFNNLTQFEYTISQTTVGDIRFRVNGKNPASTNFYIRLQRFEIRKLTANIAVVDSLSALTAARMRSMIGSFGANYTVVSGTWIAFSDIFQTDFDDQLVASAGYIYNSSAGDTNEIKWANVTLNAGTYSIKVGLVKGSVHGILEILHGATSIGSYDCYAAAPAYNTVATFAYSPAVRNVADFRLRVNGKNIASASWNLYISRIEIFKTA